MNYLLIAIGILLSSSFLCIVLNKIPNYAARGASVGMCMSAFLGCIPCFHVLLGGVCTTVYKVWDVPFGAFVCGIDPLSAFFLFLIFLISSLSSVYAIEYLSHWYGKKAIGIHMALYQLLVVSMVLVVIARNAILFLFAWELMSITSFFLVTFLHEDKEVRKAGIMYLVASHIGTACLFLMFMLWGKGLSFLNFDAYLPITGGCASLLFVLGLVGFGVKAGIMPFHVWLPQAHPAAPSHVSALMSGIMIKMGVYGIVRCIVMWGTPFVWWGLVLVGIGLVSGCMGVLFACAQKDMKRLLAYSSIENIGLIMIEIGIGVIGMAKGIMIFTILGFGAAMVHIMNHALCKSLLFLGVGAVVHTTHIRNRDLLGGLLKSMPKTGKVLCVGAMTMAGLPPLCIFLSEFMLYWALLGVIVLGGNLALNALCILVGISFIGVFAFVCFSTLWGILFLGLPRQHISETIKDPGFCILIPLWILAGLCIGAGVGAFYLVLRADTLVSFLTGISREVVGNYLLSCAHIMQKISMIAGAIYGVSGVIIWLKKRTMQRNKQSPVGTWDCGYAMPSSRMQYTGASFVQPIIAFFTPIMRIKMIFQKPQGIFPQGGSLSCEGPQSWADRVYTKAFHVLTQFCMHARWFQHGRIQLYILYIAVTLFILLVAVHVWH